MEDSKVPKLGTWVFKGVVGGGVGVPTLTPSSREEEGEGEGVSQALFD